MERRNFTIEAYVEAGGIMGDEIEVDVQAADSIMKRTALRRDFTVTKGYFREAREAEGDEVLAIATTRIHNQREVHEVGNSGISTLIKQGGVWVQFVHDQQLWEKVDEWGRKHYRSNKGMTQLEVEKEEFVKRMRLEVAGGLQSAFWDEKKEVFIYPLKNSKKSIVMVGFLTYATVEVVRLAYEAVTANSEDHSDLLLTIRFLAGFAAVGISGVLARNGIIELLTNPREDTGIVGIFERDFPSPQIPSIILGNASLLLNSGKLIRLKKSDK